MSTDDKIAEARAYLLKQTGICFDHFTRGWTDSPIEALFVAQMLAEGWVFPHSGLWMDLIDEMQVRYGLHRGERGWQLLVDSTRGSDDEGFCTVQPSLRVGDRAYRLDFAFLSKAGRVAVELDGHDFHERTKEQAARDKSRDRDLTTAGWRVLRFTGSEVYKDCGACVRQVERVRQNLLDEHHEAFAKARGTDPASV